MKRIPFIDLWPQTREVRTEIEAAIGRVIERGIFLRGPEVERFEHERK